MVRIWFSCFTTYQLFNALYYSMKVDWTNNCKKTLIWINDTKRKIDIDAFKKYFDEIYQLDSLPDVNILKRQILKCKSGGRLFSWSALGKELKKEYDDNILVCFSDQHYVTNKLIAEFKKKKNKQIILIEEGVSTYALDKKHKDRLTSRIANLFWGLHSQNYIGENQYVDTMIVKNPEKLPVQKAMNRNVIKQNNIFCDQKWAEDICKENFEELSQISTNKPIVLWIGQCLGSDYIDESLEIEIIQDVFEVITKYFCVIVKPHPREPVGKYSKLESPNVRVIDYGRFSWFPIELTWRKICPACIITPWSSAAYSIYQTGFTGKVIYCYKIFDIAFGTDYFDSLSKETNIYDANNLEELVRYLFEPSVENDKTAKNDNDDISFLENMIARYK